ncbi:MAG: zinc ribbon domain-containing protein [Butyrivibrio sp.]|nr:zinc ribbon domain-containing protein [Acetatifactor muris]MCM1559129.1 zinc ribbon domain-containing protein [Butyrivibrio sp.]
MFCIKCGAEAPDGTEFCQKCGARLTAGTPAAGADNSTAGVGNSTTGGVKPAAGAGNSAAAASVDPARQPGNSFGDASGKKKRKKWPVVLGVAAGLFLLFIVAAMLGSGGEKAKNDKYVQMIKNGTLDDYPQKTVGDAFDDYLGSPKWESGIAEDGTRVVNVTGEIMYYDKKTDILVQFVFEDEEEGIFSYYACELNGVPQNNLFFWGLLEAIYNGDD